jgi:hypothetical protein
MSHAGFMGFKSLTVDLRSGITGFRGLKTVPKNLRAI